MIIDLLNFITIDWNNIAVTKNRLGDNYHRLIILSDFRIRWKYLYSNNNLSYRTRNGRKIKYKCDSIWLASLRRRSFSGLTTITQQCLIQVCVIYYKYSSLVCLRKKTFQSVFSLRFIRIYAKKSVRKAVKGIWKEMKRERRLFSFPLLWYKKYSVSKKRNELFFLSCNGRLRKYGNDIIYGKDAHDLVICMQRYQWTINYHTWRVPLS